MSTRWDPKSLAWICCNRELIQGVAEQLGVSAKAIAGIMAKENDSLKKQWQIQILKEHQARTLLSETTESIREEARTNQDVIAPGPSTKWNNPVLLDIGLANVQIATALRLLFIVFQGYIILPRPIFILRAALGRGTGVRCRGCAQWNNRFNGMNARGITGMEDSVGEAISTARLFTGKAHGQGEPCFGLPGPQEDV